MEQGRREMKPPPVQPLENPPPQTPPPQKCPRCDSPNMKFCYYNNYNTSQPRYFCKTCRRYWTHGGTLRNVPVGGSCRRPKRTRTSSSIRADSSTPQLAQPVSASNYSNGNFSSSSVAMNSFAQPQAPFMVGNSSSELPFLPFNQQPQNQRQPEFYQMTNQGLVEANRVLSFLNQSLDNNNNNNNNSNNIIINNNNNNNGSNPNPSVGTSFNFLDEFPGYGPPSS